MPSGAPLKVKLFFWVILGVLSTVLAEVVSGSYRFPFFDAWGLFVVFPLYALHAIILLTIVCRLGKPRLFPLFAAGCIFGLYEAYITKMLWVPTWSEMIGYVGGIPVLSFMVLVLFWHPVMSFMLPVMIGESALTSTGESFSGLPRRLGSFLKARNPFIRLALGMLLITGPLHGANSPSALSSLASGTTAGFIIIAMVWLWRRMGFHSYGMRDLLPGKRSFSVLLGLLLMIYLDMTLYLRPEAMPGIGPQMAVWILYAFFGSLLYYSSARSGKKPDSGKPAMPVRVTFAKVFVYAAAFSLLALIGSRISPFGLFCFMVVWFGGSLFGIVMLVEAVAYAIGGARLRAPRGN